MSATLDDILASMALFDGDLDTSMFNETDIARAIKEGKLDSPQRFANMMLIALRITGTGLAYRNSVDEFVWRDSSLYLTPEFLERCQGLPVIIEHPNGAVLNTEEFRDRIVGMIALPYIKGEEVWGIAKIFDMGAAEVLETEQMSTSPAVVLRNGSENQRVTTESGRTILIEGEPYLLDSLAICPLGVWDKGAGPSGVDSTLSRGDNQMTTEVELLRAEFEALKRSVVAQPTGQTREQMLEHQRKAQPVFEAFGDSAPPFAPNETPREYALRLLKPHQKHCKRWRDEDLTTLAAVSDSMFTKIENEFYADALVAARTTAPPGQLRAITQNDGAGRPITTYFGDENACWNQFNAQPRYLRKFLTPGSARVN